jgi:uncharacterized membrane protein YoaK (UPF0700 family)
MPPTCLRPRASARSADATVLETKYLPSKRAAHISWVPVAAPETQAMLPMLLSFNAGYVDTAGYLALAGLFTAHVTGNFATLGASLTFGTSGAFAKMLALPIFCAVVMAARLLSTLLATRQRPAFEALVALHVLLLIAGAGFAIGFGPFHDGDSWQAIVTGMVLVCAMATQNAFHRIHLGSTPPSTIMTGTTTQVMIDLADRVYGPNGTHSPSSQRLAQMSKNVVLFTIGCGAAALLYSLIGVKCFLVPPIVGSLLLVGRLILWSEARS